MTVSRAALVVAVATALAACGSEDQPAGAKSTLASGAVCPTPPPSDTYATFGQAFMTSYCTSCHSDGGMAPDHTFTYLDHIKAHAYDIDAKAGSGPNGEFAVMPPPSLATTFPLSSERKRLSVWIACGLP